MKQARSLDPGLRGFGQTVLDLPVPRDVLARARRIEEVSCNGQRHVDVYTSPLLVPDIGFSDVPFSTGDGDDSAHTADEIDQGCSAEVLFSDPDEFLAGLLAASE